MTRPTSIASSLVVTSLLGLTACPAHVVCRSCKVEQDQLQWELQSIGPGESVSVTSVTLTNAKASHTIVYEDPPRVSPLVDRRLCMVEPTQEPPTTARAEFVVVPADGESYTVESELVVGRPCQ
jgi:hypothetical protein